MGPETTINNLSMSSNSNLMTLTIPKLHDDGSNWSDYLPRLQNVMGMNGLWRHMEGTATAPVLYAMNNSVVMLADEKMPASEDQIENKESKTIEYEKREYLACYILYSPP